MKFRRLLVSAINNAIYFFEISQPGTTGVYGATSYSWVLPSGFSFVPGYPTNNYIPKIRTSSSSGTYTIRCYPQGQCGSSGTGFQSLTINIGSGGSCPNPPCEVPTPAIVINPNPSDGEIDVTFESVDELETYLDQLDFPLKLEIYNTIGGRTYRGNMTRSGLQINLNNATGGTHEIPEQQVHTRSNSPALLVNIISLYNLSLR